MRKPHLPVIVLLLAILQLVVGGLLLACGAFGLVWAVAEPSSARVTITTAGKSTTRIYDTRKEMEREAPSYQLFIFGSAIADLLLHLLMIAGAIGLLMLRAWGWWLSLAWALLRFVYQVGTFCYLWFVAMPAANRVVLVVPRDDHGVCSSLVNGNTFYHFFWALFSTGFSLYPILILVLLVLPPIWQAFARKNSEAQDDEEADRRGRSRWEDEQDEEDQPRRRRVRDEDDDEDDPGQFRRHPQR